MSSRADPVVSRRAGYLFIVGCSATVFWRSAYPTIAWWDSSNYSLAASTLGVTAPPGSLLLTLLGWPLTRLTFGASPAYVLNLFAGVLAALAVALVYVVALRLHRVVDHGRDVADQGGPAAVGAAAGAPAGAATRAAAAAGAALGALTFAFSETLWEHAVKFTPYVLTAVFTALILWTMLRWWEDADSPRAWRQIALLALLFGIDFSVHRTNALLMPGAVAWILLRHPRTLLEPRTWLAGAGGLIAGLAVHLLVMPIAATTTSPLNMFEATSWPRFWDYVSLAHTGGNFLIDLWPRKSDLWSVQLADFLRVFGNNFGVLATLAGAVGIVTLLRRNRRLGIAFTLLLVLHAAMTVLYFNIPAGYFRSLDRHYLPVCVTFAVAIAFGMSVVLQAVLASAGSLAVAGRRRATVAGALVALVPAAQLVGNWPEQDASNRHFARDYAANALGSLPPNAIYFTVGDNDTFPVLYLQAVEGVRRDVRIVNLSMANASWYTNHLVRRDPAFPMTMTREERDALYTRAWTDTTIVIPVAGTAEQLGLAAESIAPAVVTLQAGTKLGTQVLPADFVVLDILRTNRWRRPVNFAITAGSGLGWLERYARLDGLSWRIVPVETIAGAARESALLRTHLLGEYVYRGFADPSVTIDAATHTIGAQYLRAFTVLIDAEAARGDAGRCRQAAAKLLEAIPPERLGVPGYARDEVNARCGELP